MYIGDFLKRVFSKSLRYFRIFILIVIYKMENERPNRKRLGIEIEGGDVCNQLSIFQLKTS